ncbi:unnamed protein product [Diamesa serratosioi]
MVSKVISFEELLAASMQQFRDLYKTEPEVAACAPGRVNLIGEHVDYCDGFVLPMALPMVTILVGRKNGTKSHCDITTLCDGADEPRHITFDSTDLQPGLPKWANYIKGVVHNYGFPVAGFDVVINTNVPVGGGLSSSAALEVSTLKFLEVITNQCHEKQTDKALICQKAEHDFAGMPCGIMDQFVSVMGKKNHALLIDCQLLTAQHIPFESTDLVIMICNSNVKHELSDSEYPTRRKQCSEALKIMGLKSYRQANLSNLNALKNADEVLLKRARHVITEVQRTIQAAEAMKSHDFIKVGKLMSESHKSLSSDFEVSCQELDQLTELAMRCDGVLGSRMTGGGFGGCTVTLLKATAIDNVINQINSEYNGATFFMCKPDDGARAINIGNYN